MAGEHPITFTIMFLNTLSTRPIDHADSITNVAAHDMETDIRLASRVCNSLAGMRFRVAEIAELALAQDGAATRRAALTARPSEEEGGATGKYASRYGGVGHRIRPRHRLRLGASRPFAPL